MMVNKNRAEWVRLRRQAILERRAAKKAGKAPVVKPLVVPAPRLIDVPIIVPVVPTAPAPKETMVPHEKPYMKKRGEWVCEVCGYELKTEAGIVAHVRAKHPEVDL